jgi:hypothetical protein
LFQYPHQPQLSLAKATSIADPLTSLPIVQRLTQNPHHQGAKMAMKSADNLRDLRKRGIAVRKTIRQL